MYCLQHHHYQLPCQVTDIHVYPQVSFGDICLCHHLRQSGIISLDPLCMAPFLSIDFAWHYFSRSTLHFCAADLFIRYKFSNASPVITQPRNNICLFLIVTYNVLLSLAFSKHLLVTQAVQGFCSILCRNIFTVSKFFLICSHY